MTRKHINVILDFVTGASVEADLFEEIIRIEVNHLMDEGEDLLPRIVRLILEQLRPLRGPSPRRRR